MKIRQKLFLFAFIILTGNAILGYAIFKSNQKLLESEKWLRHSEQVINQSVNILSTAQDIENASRGFVITNDSSYLAPLMPAKKIAFIDISYLKQLTIDNPVQQPRIDSLSFYMHKRLDFSLKTVDIRSKQGLAPAIAFVLTKQGRLYTAHIRQVIQAIQAEENRLLILRTQANKRSLDIFHRLTVIMFLLMAALTTLLLIVTGKYLRQNKEKEKRAAELLIANEELLFQNEEKAKHAAELNRVNRLYAFLSQVNQNIVRVHDENTLFHSSCNIAIEFGKFKIAWVGLFDKENKTITSIDQAGIPHEDAGYFKNIPLVANGPQEYVLNTGDFFICNDIMNNPGLDNWKPMAVKYGVSSFMIVAIKKMGNVIGSFNLYADDLDFFKEEEIELMIEVGGDISFALDTLENEKVHKHTEELLVQNEKRYRALIEKGTDMVTLSTTDGELIYGTDSITKGLGYSVEELLHMSVFDIIHPDDIPEVVKNKNKIVRAPGKSFYYLQRRKHKNGNWIWCEGTLTNMLHEPGINALVSNFKDISEKKMMDQQLNINEKRFRALVENGTDAMAILSPEGNVNYISPSIEKILGYTEEEAKKLNKFSLIYPDDLDSAKEMWEQMLANYGVPFRGITCRVLHKDGSWRWLEATLTNLLDDPAINGIVDNFRDVTEKKLAEEGLQLTQLALDNAGDAVFWMTPDARIVKVNEAACTMLGYKRKELVKLTIPDIDPYYNARQWPIHFAELRQEGSLFFESVQRAKDGSLIPVEIRANYIKMGDAEFNCAFIRDISERKQAEAERTQMVNDMMLRNIELEQFGYIISHNLRAPVANIIGASSALNDPELSTEDKEILSKGISQSVIKLDNVVKDLNHILQVKGEVNDTKEVVRFSELVDDIKISIKYLIDKDDIEIKYNFSEIDELLTLKPYLYSVFYNLISNSVKYRRQQIHTIIEIKSRRLKNKIELFFTDNGMGINLEKSGSDVFGLYKRFHTNIEGKGMGLFMVKTQVETLGGKISLKSRENEGAEFRIEFDL